MRCLLLFMACFSLNLVAATVDTNHSAVLLDTSNPNSANPTGDALLAVLSKKSGLSTKEISANYQIDESFNASVLRTYLENVPVNVSPNAQWFNLMVNSEKLQELMVMNRIPVWPDRRSKLFVWVVEENSDQELVNSDTHSAAVYWLKKWFKLRGIPTDFYDANAEDSLQFQPQDVRYLNPDLIDYVYSNYAVEQALLVFLKDTGTGYTYRFGLARMDRPTEIKNLTFIDLASGMSTLTSDLQEILADGQRIYAEEFSSATVALTINDVTDADKMLKLLTYLDEHALIDDYQINQHKAGQLKLMTSIKVLPDTFVKFVAAENILEHLPLNIGSELVFEMVK